MPAIVDAVVELSALLLVDAAVVLVVPSPLPAAVVDSSPAFAPSSW
ncbi:MAG: hypothetical protein U0168_12360 [Nannocystaceae bacterium]